jgi:hypothetical protein
MVFIDAETRKYCSNRKAYRKPKMSLQSISKMPPKSRKFKEPKLSLKEVMSGNARPNLPSKSDASAPRILEAVKAPWPPRHASAPLSMNTT